MMSNYYLKELRYLPARLNEYLNFYKASLKKEISRKIHNRRLEQVENTRTAIDKLLENYWNGPDFKYKVISQQEEMLKDIIAKLELEKKKSESQSKNEKLNTVIIPYFIKN